MARKVSGPSRRTWTALSAIKGVPAMALSIARCRCRISVPSALTARLARIAWLCSSVSAPSPSSILGLAVEVPVPFSIALSASGTAQAASKSRAALLNTWRERVRIGSFGMTLNARQLPKDSTWFYRVVSPR